MKNDNKLIDHFKSQQRQAEELASKTNTFKIKADGITYVEEGLVHNLSAEYPELAQELAELASRKIYQELINLAEWYKSEATWWTNAQEQKEKEADNVEP